MLVHCPSCDAQMDPQAGACPICLRKRTRQEIFAGLRGEDSARSARSGTGRGGWRAALYLLAGAAFVTLAYKRMEPTPPPPVAPAAEEAAGLADFLPAQSPPRDAVEATEPASAGSPAAVRAPASASPVPSTHWRVKGGVYDMIDLKPIAGARVELKDASSGEAHRGVTGAKGDFVLRVPKIDSGGYVLAISRKGYRLDYLEDSEPSLLTKGAAARREAVRLVEESRVLHVPLLPMKEEDEVSTNYFLIPARPL